LPGGRANLRCDDAGGGTDGEQVVLDLGLCYIEDDHYVYSSNLLCGSVTPTAVWGLSE
jgi:hypothetical protein